MRGLRLLPCWGWIGRSDWSIYFGMKRAVDTRVGTNHRVCGNLEWCKKGGKEVADFHDHSCRRECWLRLGICDGCGRKIDRKQSGSQAILILLQQVCLSMPFMNHLKPEERNEWSNRQLGIEKVKRGGRCDPRRLASKWVVPINPSTRDVVSCLYPTGGKGLNLNLAHQTIRIQDETQRMETSVA